MTEAENPSRRALKFPSALRLVALVCTPVDRTDNHSTEEGEYPVIVFNENQINTLKSMFDHMWAGTASLHDNINEDSIRVAARIDVLCTKGVLTPEQATAIIHMVHMEVSERREPVSGTDWAQEIMLDV
jgi:hypothetical protein